MRLIGQTLAGLVLGGSVAVAAEPPHADNMMLASPASRADRLRIDGVAYRNGGSLPVIHFSDGGWAYLSKGSRLDVYRGRALLAIATLAYEIQTKVRVVCNQRDSREFIGLWLKDDGS
ncbi:hypothetical protein [Burkholderia pyrrocinia]|uniref:hypothetical protein n=1 Tax=Burkholderia pyrrocinia TaxID=60550 RepID=UPI00158894AC|nr:hypothetical protein [Burkholderia pyrrocinia]